MFDNTKYFPHSLDSYHPSQSVVSEETEPDNPVTTEMVFYPKCDELLPGDPISEATDGSEPFTPQLMIIYEDGDLNSALHYLVESVQNPFQPNAFAMVLVEEKIRNEVVDRIKSKMRPLCEFVVEHPKFQATMGKIGSLNVETIVAEPKRVAPPLVSPVLVCEATHHKLGDAPTGVVTFHSFRNNLEAIKICQRETLSFKSVCCWDETMNGTYDIVAALKCPHFFINCCNVTLAPIIGKLKAKENWVAIAGGLHYETVTIYEQAKVIVFPIGDAIVASPVSPAKEEEPISFLDA
ncbi:hypothetical protein KR018_011226 [Drosophila ironensis]|nr:hypothetical protein KR018_011226 [Drosophila ironensis]